MTTAVLTANEMISATDLDVLSQAPSLPTAAASRALVAPGQDLETYIQTVGGIAILSVEEEQALARRFASDGDLEAARQLVLAHLRFVVHIARGYAGYGLPQGDLIQEGNVGLMKAVKRFDPDYGVRLVSFAVHWIKAEIHEFILRNWRIVKVATTKAQRKLFFNLRSSKKRLGWMNREEVNAVALDLGVDAKEVLRMERRLAASDAPFDGAVDDEENATSPSQYLTGDTLDPAEIVAAADEEEATTAVLHQGFEALDERSRDILASRWLQDDKLTLHQLADRYDVSAERIRQIEKAAMKKLRTALEAAA